MKKTLKLLFTCLLFLGVTLGEIVNIKALTPGGTYTVSLGCGVNEGQVGVSVSNGSLVSASTNWCDRGGSVTVTARAGSAGTSTVVLYAVDTINTSNLTEVAAGTTLSARSVSVTAPSSGGGNSNTTGGNTWGGSGTTTSNPTSSPEGEPDKDPRSKNNDLASLTVSQGELTPAFSKDVTAYKVNLPSTTKSIKVDAKASDEKASVSGTGEIKLDAGDNEINITVKSEYGTEKVYKINAVVDEKPLLYTTYNAQKLGVVRTLKNVTAPSGFKETKTKLDGKEISAWTNDSIQKTIVYLVDEKGNKNFYLFDDGKVVSIFIPKQILGKNIYLIDVPKKLQSMEGMKYQKLKIDGLELMGWTFKDKTFKNFQVIYVMDMDGKERYYQYETEQKTLQLYNHAAPVSQAEYEKELSQLRNEKMIWMAVGIGAIVILIGLFLYILFVMKRKKAPKSILPVDNIVES